MNEQIWCRHKVEVNAEDALVAISRPATHFVISGRANIHRLFKEVVLTPARYFKQWTLGSFYFAGPGEALYEDQWAESRDQAAILQSLFGLELMPPVQVFWGSNESEFAIIVNQPCFCTEPLAPTNQQADWADALEHLVPGYREHYERRRRAKSALLRQVNPLNSLAELEKQVDLLAAIVMALVPRTVPEAERPAWWGRFAALTAEYDSTVLKGRDAALDDIEAQKQFIRDLIATYHKNRDGA